MRHRHRLAAGAVLAVAALVFACLGCAPPAVPTAPAVDAGQCVTFIAVGFDAAAPNPGK